MRSLSKQLGARIKQLREEQGFDVIDVASSTGVHKSTIYNIESGRHLPSMKHLSQLAKALRCDEIDLLCFPGAGARHDVLELLRRTPSAALAVKNATADLLEGKPPRGRSRRD
jgi:transcriptional regulator with XRE-family HTH domain